MLTVNQDPHLVESQLNTGKLPCPTCAGHLGPWGHARKRNIRHGMQPGNEQLMPRRARCRTCQTTHVLLPLGFAARRADEAAVIAYAIEAHTSTGAGHRKLAARLERPESTVRGWLRTFTRSAAKILRAFTTRVHQGTAQALKLWPAPATSTPADTLSMLLAHARMLAVHHSPGLKAVGSLQWQQGALAAHGPWFFSTTGWAG